MCECAPPCTVMLAVRQGRVRLNGADAHVTSSVYLIEPGYNINSWKSKSVGKGKDGAQTILLMP